MKKRIIGIGLATGIATLGLAGCSLFGGGGEEGELTTSTTAEVSEKEEQGSSTEKDGIKKTVVYSNDNLDIENTVGPVIFTIDSIQVADMTATTDTASSMLGIDKNQDATMITVKFSCKNTSDSQANFYASKAILTADSGEESEPVSYYGEYMDAHIGGGDSSTKTGTNVYVLEDTKASDIKSVEIHFDAPQDWDFKDMDDDIDVEVELD